MIRRVAGVGDDRRFTVEELRLTLSRKRLQPPALPVQREPSKRTRGRIAHDIRRSQVIPRAIRLGRLRPFAEGVYLGEVLPADLGADRQPAAGEFGQLEACLRGAIAAPRD